MTIISITMTKTIIMIIWSSPQQQLNPKKINSPSKQPRSVGSQSQKILFSLPRSSRRRRRRRWWWWEKKAPLWSIGSLGQRWRSMKNNRGNIISNKVNDERIWREKCVVFILGRHRWTLKIFVVVSFSFLLILGSIFLIINVQRRRRRRRRRSETFDRYEYDQVTQTLK